MCRVSGGEGLLPEEAKAMAKPKTAVIGAGREDATTAHRSAESQPGAVESKMNKLSGHAGTA